MAESLRKLEQTLYRNVVDCGVWDTVLGFWLLAIGGAIAVGAPAIVPFVAAAAFPVGYTLAKRTIRRVGDVRFNVRRTRRLRQAAVVVPVAAIVLIVAFVAAGEGLPGLAKAAIVVAGPLSIAAVLFEIHRFHVYAATVLAATGVVLVAGYRGNWR